MDRHLKDYEVEEALQDMFGLPDDPDQSDDNLESDDECPNFSVIRLQHILEDIDDPRPANLLVDNIPIPSPSSVDEQIDQPCSPLLVQEVDNNPDNFSPILDSNRRITRPRRVTPIPSTSDLQRPVPSVPVLPVIDDFSDSDQSDTEEVLWKKKTFTTVSRPNPCSFDEPRMQPVQGFNSKTRPIVYFEKYFTEEAYDLIVCQTNLYAQQQNFGWWTPIDKNELKAFLGILIIMGYHILPSIDLYWSSDPGFRVEEVAATMPLRRFKNIMRCLHINDNLLTPEKSSPDYDKLYKIRPLVNIINNACQINAKNSSSQSIDESMVLFKGRSTIKQYMPLKPIKRGYKIWCRCDSASGYLYEFDIYTGKTNDGVEEGLGAKIVKKLSDKLIQLEVKNVHLTFDNFFCDYKLLDYLHEKGIFATGTVRRHRAEMPLIIKNKTKLKLPKGHFKWRVQKNVAFVVWQDSKEVLLMSNAFHPKVAQTHVTRTEKDGSKKNVPCPLVVKEYNKRMGGVDHFDQLKGTYSVGRRSKRWWLRLFYFLIDTSITNAFLLYKSNKKCTLSHLEFRVGLARGLIGGFTSRKRRSTGGMPSYVSRRKLANENRQKIISAVPEEVRYTNVGDHMPCQLQSYKRCKMCSTKTNDKRSKIMCAKCQVALCIAPCFSEFHKK